MNASENSTAFGVALDHADVDVAMTKGVATVNRFETMGPQIHATAKGDLALGQTGTSNLQYRIEAIDFGVLLISELQGHFEFAVRVAERRFSRLVEFLL